MLYHFRDTFPNIFRDTAYRGLPSRASWVAGLHCLVLIASFCSPIKRKNTLEFPKTVTSLINAVIHSKISTMHFNYQGKMSKGHITSRMANSADPDHTLHRMHRPAGPLPRVITTLSEQLCKPTTFLIMFYHVVNTNICCLSLFIVPYLFMTWIYGKFVLCFIEVLHPLQQ